MLLLLLQDLEPEVRTFNTAIIACNMCGQPQEALKVGGLSIGSRLGGVCAGLCCGMPL